MLTKSLIFIACSGALLLSANAADMSLANEHADRGVTPIMALSSSPYTQEQKEKQEQKVNINRASAEELAEALRGVGMARARAIIKLREELGQFTDVEQLLQVRGLGVKVLNENREKITL